MFSKSKEKHIRMTQYNSFDLQMMDIQEQIEKKRAIIYKIQIEQKNDMKKLPTWFVLEKEKLNILTEQEYFEGTIDPNNGADWNQTPRITPNQHLMIRRKSFVNI